MTVKLIQKMGQIELTDDDCNRSRWCPTEIFVWSVWLVKIALKDNFQALLGKENIPKGIVIKATEDGSIAVDVYTVLSYRKKISEVSKNIQKRVRF